MSLHTLDIINANPSADDKSTEPAGYIIDEQGREIAITEQMIQRACTELDQHWQPTGAAMNASARA